MLSFYLLLSSCTCFTSSPALLLHYYMYSTNHLYVKSSSNMLLRHLTSAVLSCMLKNLCILSENVLFCPTATESNESFDLKKRHLHLQNKTIQVCFSIFEIFKRHFRPRTDSFTYLQYCDFFQARFICINIVTLCFNK